MKIDNSSYIFKGILLTVCGVLFAFFPGVLSWIFYIIGGIIIIGSVVTVLGGLGSGDVSSLLPAGAVGVLIGILVMYLPKIITAQMSVIAGIILGIVAITQIVKSLSKDFTKGLKLGQLIFGVVLLVCSMFLMFNPFKGGNIIRIIIGIVMLLFAAFNYYVAYTIKQRNASNPSNIIDVTDFTTSDDDHKRIQ
ncbi:DUF308 domain-containing protein [Ruminococcus flavefaciens]|uniref:DUF308 domain-containing protein n=1 Tax=Ruminococcus flavefaciens TaxID=1265 RepID=UPI0026EA5A1C|nr:DUF308 domain-containing protein [Ruminococcus flavefaciens]MDD7516703.1 DUF308 domain-containing protein [Ruminococcus flavefaciens]MDY5690052.1 DUF308 domain-containing protein [Ruminococcus flavefaciens]